MKSLQDFFMDFFISSWDGYAGVWRCLFACEHALHSQRFLGYMKM